eukprot:13090225-Ditylum_brightwellii.AAC.1
MAGTETLSINECTAQVLADLISATEEGRSAVSKPTTSLRRTEETQKDVELVKEDKTVEDAEDDKPQMFLATSTLVE